MSCSVLYFNSLDFPRYRKIARRQYTELTSAERDWRTLDLEAARTACSSRLDFTKLLPEADRLLGAASARAGRSGRLDLLPLGES